MRAGSSAAQLKEVVVLLQSSKEGEPVAVHAQGALTAERAKFLRTFLRTASGAVSFFAIPGFQSYATLCWQIFGILRQTVQTFEVGRA